MPQKVSYDKSWDAQERSLELTLHMRSSTQSDMADDLIELALAIRSGVFPPERWKAGNCPHNSQIIAIQTYDQQAAQEEHDRRLREFAEELKQGKRRL